MIRKLKIKGIKWIDGVNLKKQEIYNVLKKYDFHELDIEACLESNQRARVDSYDDYLFMVLHFPKYNVDSKVYELNEFNIFLGHDFLITFRDQPGNFSNTLFSKYEKMDLADGTDKKMSPGYILYEIIEGMLLKMFKVCDNISKDVKELEKDVFERINSNLVKEIMIKKRNIMVLKNMFLPQISVMKLIETNTNKFFAGEIEEYFEDLEDKIEQIVNDIKMLEEYIYNVEDSYKSMIDIKTNNVMRILAFFSAFMLPLTLITSFYGMNIDIPFSNTPSFVYILLFFTLISMGFIYIYLKKKDKF